MEVGVVNIAEQPDNIAPSTRPPSGIRGAKGRKLVQYRTKVTGLTSPKNESSDGLGFSIVNGYNGAQEALVCCAVASQGKKCDCANTITGDDVHPRQPIIPARKPMTFLNAGIPIDITEPKNFKKVKNRPCSAKVGIDNEASKLLKRRPASAHTIGDKQDNNEVVPEPFVYGYFSQKTVSGDKNHIPAKFQYRTPSLNHVKPKTDKPWWETQNRDDVARVPKTLEPLIPWLTTGIPAHITGVDPSKCLAFLPSLCSDYENLPVVPSALKGDEELPFKEDVTDPIPQTPKKYDHPSWNKLHLPEWQCSHTSCPSQVRVFSKTGALLYESRGTDRTIDVVRQEIKELEELMKGIGSANGCSMVVQYQAEINKLQKTVNQTLGRVEEIERRLAEEAALNEPTDYFGFKKFYEEHEDVMEQIKQQHQACIAELAHLEAELELDSSRKHFRNQLSSA